MEISGSERALLARTQTLMVAVSLVPLAVLLYLAANFVFPALAESGQDHLIPSIALTLVFTVMAVVLGYVLVRRDTLRTIHAIQEGERRLDALHAAVSRIGEATDPEEAERLLLSEAQALVGAQRAALWRRDRDALSVSTCAGQSEERARQHPLPMGSGIVGTAASTGRVLRDATLGATDLGWDDRVMARTASSLILPLLSGDRVVAVLDLRNRLGATAFSAVDEQLASGLGRQAMLFLDNATFRAAEAAQTEQVERLVKEFTQRSLTWSEHVENVVRLCMRIADVMELPDDARALLRRAALVHDVGLLDVPRPNIGPPGGPVDHPASGADRLAAMPLWADVAPIVRAHHESMDGSGPLGLSGFAIPLPARILALAEYIDTVTNPASPWGTLSGADLIAELRDPDDARFDRRVVDAFLVGTGQEA